METNELKETNKKLDQLTEISMRLLVFSMYKSGHTMDRICKNLHLSKTRVVELLEGLDKKKVT